MNTLPPPISNDAPGQWSGMTLHQIQMRRALVQARMEIARYRLTAQIDDYRRRSPLLGGSNSVVGRLAGVFSWAEYAVFAFKTWRTLSKFFKSKK